MNNIIVFIIFGIIQGITEPLPISSSGHLIIFQTILNLNIPGMSFEAFVNFGSTLAIIYYFKDKLQKLIFGILVYFIALIKSIKAKNNLKYQKLKKTYYPEWDYFLKIIVASIPLGITGIILVLLGYDDVENVKIVGIALTITAISLFIVSNFKGKKNVHQMKYTDALIVGVFQAIALMPGISRSGMTLVGLLLVGLKSEEAFSFSFVMFIPASVAALLFSLIDILTAKDLSQYFLGYFIAFILSAIFTWISLNILKRVVIANKLYYFAVYCIVVSLSILFIF
ncbi:MAG: undecaprenyl-diphosphate phosphatase [Mycoplasmatales bacterium]